MPADEFPVQQLEHILGANWANLCAARERSLFTKTQLSERISKYSNKDANIVVFGSLARNEFTDGSDIDWTLLVDGRARAKHLTTKNQIKFGIDAIVKKEVGAEGTFGNISFSHDIIHNIGGGDDTNKNTTQRILLLLESTYIGNHDAYTRVLNEIVSRYITEDWGLRNKIDTMPRFLLNDIIRYWRTLCVDFAYKRRMRDGKGWAIRTIKLRLSRKLIYAAGLLSCYSCVINKELNDKIDSCSSNKQRQLILISHLVSEMTKPPLDILSSMILPYENLYEPIRKIMDSYDSFIAMLSDKDIRDRLEKLPLKQTNNDQYYEAARKLGHSFQEGLNSIFLEENGTEFFNLTKKYGVF